LNSKVAMSLYSKVLATWLGGLGLLAVPSQTAAQVAAADSTQAKADSQPAVTDSLQGYSAYGGSSDTALQRVRPDSAAGDSSDQASPDSVRTKAEESATKADTAAVSKEPNDSILSAACSGPGGSSPVARDLLVVVFAPEAGTRERSAAAKTVKGKLLGPVSSEEPGAYYVRVPSGGDEYRLRLAADHLVQLQQVRQVGSRACPSRPPPKNPG
jgi:hypothetical protein